jgi:hypothetical protein
MTSGLTKHTTDDKPRRAHRATGRPVGRVREAAPDAPSHYSVKLMPGERAALADAAAKHDLTIPIMIRRWIAAGCPLP